MPYTSLSMECAGLDYAGHAHTVQDLDFDPSGGYIYAEGTLNVIHGWWPWGEIRSQSNHYLNNRGYSNVNGFKSYSTLFFKRGDETRCLENIISKMHLIGRQR